MTITDVEFLERLARAVPDVDAVDIKLEVGGSSVRVKRNHPSTPGEPVVRAPVSGVLRRHDDGLDLPPLGATVRNNQILAFIEVGAHRIALRAPKAAQVFRYVVRDGQEVDAGAVVLHLGPAPTPELSGNPE